LGKSEILRKGRDGTIIAIGAMLQQALTAADLLSAEGLDVTVINARFIRPLDLGMIAKVFEESRFVVTVEEGALAGGFGSAVLEAACQNGWDTRILRILGIPDRFIEHGDRNELLAEIGIDPAGIASTCRLLNERFADSQTAGV
jgi:1-deoxy-D-xylulose-5-phosphate synthase